jgi:hypothetical protein
VSIENYSTCNAVFRVTASDPRLLELGEVCGVMQSSTAVDFPVSLSQLCLHPTALQPTPETRFALSVQLAPLTEEYAQVGAAAWWDRRGGRSMNKTLTCVLSRAQPMPSPPPSYESMIVRGKDLSAPAPAPGPPPQRASTADDHSRASMSYDELKKAQADIARGESRVATLLQHINGLERQQAKELHDLRLRYDAKLSEYTSFCAQTTSELQAQLAESNRKLRQTEARLANYESAAASAATANATTANATTYAITNGAATATATKAVLPAGYSPSPGASPAGTAPAPGTGTGAGAGAGAGAGTGAGAGAGAGTGAGTGAGAGAGTGTGTGTGMAGAGAGATPIVSRELKRRDRPIPPQRKTSAADNVVVSSRSLRFRGK